MAVIGSILKRGVQLRNKLHKDWLTPVQHQEKTLRKLLKRASQTAFGDAYDFKTLLKSENLIADFQAEVPIFDYDSIHENWWYRSLNNEENVSWRGKVKYFALSSGTSGAPSKQIPITLDMMQSMRRVGLRMYFNLPKYDFDNDFYTKQMMMLGGSTDLKDEGGYYVGDLSGINASKRPFWVRKVYKPGHKIARINNWNDRITEIAKNADKWDIGSIMGIPAWLQLMIERIIEYHKVDTIHDVWPNLQYFIHGGVAFEPYKKGFENLMGRPMVYTDTYLASEGFMAFQNRPETNAMALQLNNGIFFEFIPYNEENFDGDGNIIGNPKSYSVGEVSTGIDYAIIISTCAGAWRYMIGDMVRFTDLSRAEIIITGRTKHFLSICGEHLSVDNMNTAIKEISEKHDIIIPEFTVFGIEKENFFTHKWYIGCDNKTIDKESLRLALDEALKDTNDDYRTERMAVLKDIELEVIPTSLFIKWFERRNKLGGQNKFPRVLKKDLVPEWEAFVEGQLKG